MNQQNNVIPMRPLETAPQWLHWTEAIPVSIAAKLSNSSPRTVRRWCIQYGIGAQIGKNSSWRVSRPALLAFIEGNASAVEAIKAGDRRNPLAADYYGL